MINLNNYLGKELEIISKSFWKREFLFIDNSKVIGKLYSVKIINNLFVCDFEEKKFEFYKNNVFSREILVRQKGNQLPIASFKSNLLFTSGELKLPRGRNVQIKFGLFKNKAFFYDSDTKLLFRIRCRQFIREKYNLTIENKSDILEEYFWLPLFTLYLMKISGNRGATFH